MIDLELQSYTDWSVGAVFKLPNRNNYAFRVRLKYENGFEKIRQKSGFPTKKEAEEARNKTIAELFDDRYIVNNGVRYKELLEVWLENDVLRRVKSSNTYETYRNIAERHIIPRLGRKKLAEINKGDIRRLYQDRADFSASIAHLVKTVVNMSLSFATLKKLIPVNPAKGVRLPKSVEKKPYHQRSIETAKTLTLEQIRLLLEASKDTPIHMQILFNVLMGLRRQEINGLKYSDVDYIRRTLTIQRQLGKKLDGDKNGGNHTTKEELPLKTASSRRVLPIPDIVFEAILEERKIYERNRSRRRSEFLDAGFICCSTRGKPRSKDFHWPHYKELLEKTGLPDIRWHDLRSTYCTLLLKNDFSPKAVSAMMGHAKEIITVDVYGDSANIRAAEIPELIAYMEEVLPKEEEQTAEEVLINLEPYLP